MLLNLSRSAPGCVAAARPAGPVGEDGLEGPEPSPAGAVFLQRIAGGSLVSAQRQPRPRAWPPKAAARPERRAATGSLITSVVIPQICDIITAGYRGQGQISTSALGGKLHV